MNTANGMRLCIERHHVHMMFLQVAASGDEEQISRAGNTATAHASGSGKHVDNGEERKPSLNKP